MAPKKMPGGKTRAQRRFEKLRYRAAQADFSTPEGSKLIFDYYQKGGYLPAKDAQGHPFKSLEEFLQTIQKKVEAVKTANPNISNKEALRLVESRLAYNKALRSAKTGEDIGKVTDLLKADPEKRLASQRAYSGLPLTISDTGKIGINRRQYMSADGGLPRPVFDEIASFRGIEEAQRYEKAVKAEWKKMGDIGRQLSSETGIPFHRGHWVANKYGGAESARAGSLEIGALNELHGAAPRGDVRAVAETGRGSMGWLEDFTNWDLAENKLNVLGAEHLKHSDLQAISNGVDHNRLIAQRVAEFNARGGIPDPDEIGPMLGSQLDRDETIGSQFGRVSEEQQRVMKETGFDPRYGKPATGERLAEVTQDVNRSKRLVPEIPKTGGRLAPVLATEAAGNRALAQQLMPTRIARNPLMRGAKAISRAIPGPADALIPGVVGGGLALAGGATLPQAAEAFGSGVAEGLTGDIDAGPLANNQAYVVNGQQRFINQRNELVDQPGYGLQQRNGNWEVVKRGTGVAAQQERQDNQRMMQQASNLIPKVNRAMNPVGAKITNEAQYFIINPLQKAFKNVFGNREI
jgi:hypothetical protein